jgi:hypothetical protein
MAKEEMKSGLHIARGRMIQLLNEDLAGETETTTSRRKRGPHHEY